MLCNVISCCLRLGVRLGVWFVGCCKRTAYRGLYLWHCHFRAMLRRLRLDTYPWWNIEGSRGDRGGGFGLFLEAVDLG